MGNSIIYNYIFKGIHDWRSFDAGVMEKVIAVNFVLGVVANLTWNETTISIYNSVYQYSTIYFVVGPVFAYYRTFKTDNCRYVFITPIKKLKVLLSLLLVWAVGFLVFLFSRVLILLMNGSFVKIMHYGDTVHDIIYFTNILMIVLSVYCIILSADIISVVKRIPRIIVYPIAACIFFIRAYIPDFLVFKSNNWYGFLPFKIDSRFLLGNSSYTVESITTIGPNLVSFIVSFVIFMYALYIFEGYNGEIRKGFVGRYLIRK